MSSLQNIPYDLLLSIAQHLDLADIYALQLVRFDRLFHSENVDLRSSSRHAGTYATRFTPAQYIESWLSASSGVVAHSHSTASNVFPIFLLTNLSKW